MDGRTVRQSGFVGRAGEVAALTGALGAAAAGRPGKLLVEGPPGIGKSALVAQVLRAHPGPLRVVRATGVSWESELTFGVAGRLARETGGDPPAETARPDTVQPETVLDAADRLNRLWTAAQQDAPLVIVVDDAHWADLASLRAACSALRRMSTERVLLILIARDDSDAFAEPPPVAALDFLDAFRDRAVRLGPLRPEEVKALALETAGLALSLPAARQLARHTLGNPLHIGRLLRELPRETWQNWQPELPAPARYAAAVRQRLAGCGPDTRALVEACAILPDDTPVAEAAELAGIDAALPAADQAQAAGLLTATGDPVRTRLSFPHPLVRAAVLTGIGLTARAALHRRAADLTADHGRRLMHRVAAVGSADAELADELDRFGAERAQHGEWGAVAEILVKAGLLTPTRALRRDRMLRAVDAMIGAGDVPQAMLFADELESFPPGTLRDAVLGYLAIMRGRAAEAEALLNRAWERVPGADRPELTAKICHRQVLHALGRWHPADLVTWAQRAIELADPTDPSVIESQAIMGIGLAAMGRGEEAGSRYETAAAGLSEGAYPQRFQLGRGWVDLALDQPEAARREFEAAVPTGFRMGSTRISLWGQGWLARAQFALGEWPEAVETVDRAAARLAEARIELVRPLVHWTGAQIHALRGDWESAEHHLQEAAADLHDYEVMLVPACLARAQVAEARADYERVLEALSPLVHLPTRDRLAEPGFWPWPEVYANALVLVNRAEEADAFLAPHEELAARRGHRSAQARLGLARGRVLGAKGDIEAAQQVFEQCLAHLDGLPLRYDRARVNYAYGQTLRRAGKRREADTVLKNARDAYLTLGARTYVERCDRELKAGGLHTGRAAPGLARLTPQEQAVARLVAQGRSNQQVALELFISVKTVQYHLTHIYAKLSVRSRAELAAGFRDADEPAD